MTSSLGPLDLHTISSLAFPDSTTFSRCSVLFLGSSVPNYVQKPPTLPPALKGLTCSLLSFFPKTTAQGPWLFQGMYISGQ